MSKYSLGMTFTGIYDHEAAIWCSENGFKIQEIEKDENGERVFQISECSIPTTALINILKEELKSSDYKIIKCYELDLVGEPMPYNILDLHEERQSIRDQIKNLETQITNL